MYKINKQLISYCLDYKTDTANDTHSIRKSLF